MIGLGKLAITLKHSITNVLHVDSLSYNLLSVYQLCEMGYNCLFADKCVEVFRREDSSIVLIGRLKNKLYLVDFNKSKVKLETCLVAMMCSSPSHRYGCRVCLYLESRWVGRN